MNQPLKYNTFWIRDGRQHVFPPGPNWFDVSCCMNPCVHVVDGEYWMYYAGGDARGYKRVCLATVPVGQAHLPTAWKRHGPVMDKGPAGSYDAHWNVIPNVIRLGPQEWRLYFTANSGVGAGLSSFPGMGVAFSSDGKHFEKYAGNPIIGATKRPGDPDREGMGGGSVLKVRLPDGGEEWRWYYTACPTIGDDYFLHQQKFCALAVSRDGLTWERRGAVMARDWLRDYVDVAAATPVVKQLPDGSFRMWYSAIGTRWGYYSLGYAESPDGLTWHRGPSYGDDLQLGPTGSGWERQMVQYPDVVREGRRLRLFYCGNGYGSEGIGSVQASSLRATPLPGAAKLRVCAEETGAAWTLRFPEGLSSDEGLFKTHDCPAEQVWHGPDATGQYWHEYRSNAADLASMQAEEARRQLGLKFIGGIHYRVIVGHALDGLTLRCSVTNESAETLHQVTAFPCFGFPEDPAWRDPGLERTFVLTANGLTALKDTDRGTGKPCRTHYRVAGERPLAWYAPSYWGEASQTPVTKGVIIRTSQCGGYSLGMAWEKVSEVFHNEDEHSCLHAVPTLGDIPPGETCTVRGKLIFTTGDAAAALALLG